MIFRLVFIVILLWTDLAFAGGSAFTTAIANGSAGMTLLFEDDMSGAFSDNWNDISGGGATASFSGGELLLTAAGSDCYEGAHASAKTTFPISGIYHIYGEIKPIVDAEWYQTSLSNNGIWLGFIPTGFVSDTRCWAYYVPEHWTNGTHENFVRMYIVTKNDSFGIYSNAVAGATSNGGTYVDAGGSFRSFEIIVDFDSATAKAIYEGVETSSIDISLAKTELLTHGTDVVLAFSWYNYQSGTDTTYLDNIQVYVE